MPKLNIRAIDTTLPVDVSLAIDETELAKYALAWVRNPDPGSNFAKKMGWVGKLPRAFDEGILKILSSMRYGGIVLYHNAQPVGHAFFQEHDGGEAHLFSIYVEERYRNRGFADMIMQAFLLDIDARPSISWIRISAGNNDAGVRLWLKILEGRYNLPHCIPRHEERLSVGWVRLYEKPAEMLIAA